MKPINTPKDFLTNCYNRDGILPYLRKMEDDFLANKRPFSVLMMDVDHFKSFNDGFGHLMGDEVLKYFSSSMRLDLEDEENVPFRFGGDEFVMVFPNKIPAEAYRLATRLRKNIRTRSCLIKGRQIKVTFSGGIAGYPSDATGIEDILDKADKALYYSKNHGRSRITKFADLGYKELLRLLAIALVLFCFGMVAYHFRDFFSQGTTQASSWVNRQIARVSIAPEVQVTPPELSLLKEEPPTPVEPAHVPAPEISKITLESGRVIRGVITHQDDDHLTVEVRYGQSKGVLQVKRSQIMSVESDKK